jgi:hypothetical protein
VAIPLTTKMSVPFEYVCPQGCLFLGVSPVTDFDKRGSGDDQARDKETGLRLWQVKVLDLDPEAGKFGATNELKIKVAADVQPVPPAPQVPGYPPAVEFTDVTITPYVDSQKCKGEKKPHKCGARQAWSIRAGAMVEPRTATGTKKAA